MTVTHRWTYDFKTTAADGQKDVVKEIHFRVYAEEGRDAGEVYDAVTLRPPGVDFVPFASLTEDDIQRWIAEITGVSAKEYEARAAADLDRQKMPPLETKSAPWLKS